MKSFNRNNNNYEVGSVIIPIILMWNLRHRQASNLANVTHWVSEGAEHKPRESGLEIVLLTICYTASLKSYIFRFYNDYVFSLFSLTVEVEQ